MKKSELYKLAALSVMADNSLDPEDKLAVVDLLMNDLRLCVWSETQEAEKK